MSPEGTEKVALSEIVRVKVTEALLGSTLSNADGVQSKAKAPARKESAAGSWKKRILVRSASSIDADGVRLYGCPLSCGTVGAGTRDNGHMLLFNKSL